MKQVIDYRFKGKSNMMCPNCHKAMTKLDESFVQDEAETSIFYCTNEENCGGIFGMDMALYGFLNRVFED